MQVKNRMLYLAYYLDYAGERSVKQAKAKNDAIALKFLAVNN
jgi:hypothetical protein